MDKVKKTLSFLRPDGSVIELDWDYDNGERLQEVHDRAEDDWEFIEVNRYEPWA